MSAMQSQILAAPDEAQRRVELLKSQKTIVTTENRAIYAAYSLARAALLLCCSRPLGGYPRDGFLSLFYGPGYVGHQLLQIVLGGFKLRRLFSGEGGSPAVFSAKMNSF